ncbi:MAG: SDR family oxidoreductase [Pseudomonadota bacterium]
MFDGIRYDYEGANVLVTGGSNGIGHAIACAYHSAGASVTITGRKASADVYETDLSGFAYRQLDITDKADIRALGSQLTALDILINNAGGHQYVQESEWHPDGFDAAFDVNLSGMFHLCDACLPALKASVFAGGASIVGISSSSAFAGYPPAPGYSAAKAAMVQLVQSYAVQWGPLGIRANAIAPGFIVTNLTRLYLDNSQAMIDGTALGRLGTPEDIAAAVLFVTSPAASWITGQTLSVDGGFTVKK